MKRPSPQVAWLLVMWAISILTSYLLLYLLPQIRIVLNR